MTAAMETSTRRLRTKLPARQAAAEGKSREVLGVRYPWTGWGADEYAHRSLFPMFPGAGEPVYDTEPTPSREAMRGVVLTTANSKREIFTWKHTHVLNWATPTPAAGGVYVTQQTDPWWVEAINAHPTTTVGGETWASPQPMSDAALWWRIADGDNGPGDWNDPTPGVRFPTIWVMTGSPTIGASMTWSATKYDDSIVRINRKCSRVLCYKDVTRTGETINFTPSTPFCVLRRACKDSAANTVDVRFEPFGWGDALYYSDGYQRDTVLSADCPKPPPHTATVLATQEYNFATGDLSHLSAARVSDGFAYASPHNDNLPFQWDYIAEGQKFDLIIDASFYRYKWWKYDSDAAGSGMEKMILHASGFAGIYGTCNVIF